MLKKVTKKNYKLWLKYKFQAYLEKPFPELILKENTERFFFKNSGELCGICQIISKKNHLLISEIYFLPNFLTLENLEDLLHEIFQLAILKSKDFVKFIFNSQNHLNKLLNKLNLNLVEKKYLLIVEKDNFQYELKKNDNNLFEEVNQTFTDLQEFCIYKLEGKNEQ